MATLYGNNMTNFNPGMASAGSPQQWFINQYNQMNPQLNYTTDAFNNAVKAGRTDLAYMMLSQGGEGFRQAVRQANGWDSGQLNSVINSYGLYQTNPNTTGMAARYSPDNINALKSFGATAAPQSYSTDPNWVHNMNQQYGTGQGAVANPNSYGAGYTGFGNSVLAGRNPQAPGSGTTTGQQQGPLPTVSGGPQYSGPVAPPPNANNTQVNTAPSPTAGVRVAPPPTAGATTSLGVPGTTVTTPKIPIPPARYVNGFVNNNQ